MDAPVLPFDLMVVQAPAESAVSLDVAKMHLRVVHDEEDDLIQSYIDAAVTLVEDVYTWRAFVTRTYQVRMSAQSPIWLPYPPVQAITSIALLDAQGNLAQELEPMQWSLRPSSGIVVLGAYANRAQECVIEYVAGYGDPEHVPATFRQAILLLVGHAYENREAVVLATQPAEVQLGVERLTLPYRAERPQWGQS